jgi:hypothetical protein
VRLEVGRALGWGIPVVPLLVGGGRLPEADELPPELRELVRRQSVTLRDETWHADVTALVRSLRGERVTPVEPTRHRRRLVVGVARLVLVAMAGAAWWWGTSGDTDGEDDEEADIASCAPPTGESWTSVELNHETVDVPDEEEGSLVFEVRGARWRELDPGWWEVILETGMTASRPDGADHEYWRYGELVVGRMAFEMDCFSANGEVVIADTMGTALVGYVSTCRPVGYMQLVLADGYRLGFTQDQEPGEC